MEALSDPSLCDESQLMEAKMCMEVGLLCTQLDRNDRPTMADVLAMLNGRKELPDPKKPAGTSGPGKGRRNQTGARVLQKGPENSSARRSRAPHHRQHNNPARDDEGEPYASSPETAGSEADAISPLESPLLPASSVNQIEKVRRAGEGYGHKHREPMNPQLDQGNKNIQKNVRHRSTNGEGGQIQNVVTSAKFSADDIDDSRRWNSME